MCVYASLCILHTQMLKRLKSALVIQLQPSVIYLFIIYAKFKTFSLSLSLSLSLYTCNSQCSTFSQQPNREAQFLQ